MICSAFNDKTGQYDYYETGTEVPFNADLPVPELPASAGRVGVAAIDAGRPMPIGAKYVGSGWTARGMVVQRSSGGLSGELLDLASNNSLATTAAVTLATYLIVGAVQKKRDEKSRALWSAGAGAITLGGLSLKRFAGGKS